MPHLRGQSNYSITYRANVSGFGVNTAAQGVGPEDPTIINSAIFGLELFVKIPSL